MGTDSVTRDNTNNDVITTARGMEIATQKSVMITSKSDWDHVDRKTVEMIVVNNKCCNEEDFNILDLSDFQRLKELIIGYECFENVKVVRLVGMNELESVMIGDKSFTKAKEISLQSLGSDPIRHFYLKNCPKIRSLKIGRFSFLDYSVCRIENVPSLEVIEFGDVNRDSANFAEASLELRSCFILNPISGRYAVSQDCGHWACNNACAKTCCI